VCQLYRVTGRVQGVFFRDSTRDVASRIGVAGHAVNLPDGSVEVLACGTARQLRELEDFLRGGPPMAAVDGVTPATVECQSPESFITG
jgi:acylphosphatase